MNPTRLKTTSALLFAIFLGWSAVGFAQGAKSKDTALDDLLKKVDEAAKPGDSATSSKAKSEKPGGIAPKDKDLDSLLEKLGETKDTPSPNGGPPPSGGPGAKPPMPEEGKAGDKDQDESRSESQGKNDSKPKAAETSKPKSLTGKDKELEEHLEELAGIKKKKPQQGQGQSQGNEPGKEQDEGPLGDLVKQMREVEQRLSKPDTGEQTRLKQTEIVKRLDTMIEQMKQAKSRQQAMREMRGGKQPGNRQGDQPGAMANGPPPTLPEKPKGKSVLALDKNPWGHLPPELRAEMENVFKEELLPNREDLIKRYYLSVSKKSLTRGE